MNIQTLFHSYYGFMDLDLFQLLMLTDALWCSIRLSFWRHPFTAVHPFLRHFSKPDEEAEHWWYALQYCMYCDVCRCDEKGCDGLLRPHVIWFGETLDSQILTKVEKELEMCDLCLVVSLTLMWIWCETRPCFGFEVLSALCSCLQVGTSSVVYPAAMFGPQVASRGVSVAEFNTKTTANTPRFKWVHTETQNILNNLRWSHVQRSGADWNYG